MRTKEEIIKILEQANENKLMEQLFIEAGMNDDTEFCLHDTDKLEIWYLPNDRILVQNEWGILASIEKQTVKKLFFIEEDILDVETVGIEIILIHENDEQFSFTNIREVA